MRTLGLVAMVVLAGCSSQSAASPTSPSPSASAQATCRLPVYWIENVPQPQGIAAHTAFVDLASGAVADVGSLPPAIPYEAGATYDQTSQRWRPVQRYHLSPDLTRYAYQSGVAGPNEIHVVDIVSGADRVAYSGSTLYIVLAFESDAIYLVHGINPRQGAYEKLYRLDPGGGTPPQLVPGSDRHMSQYAWTNISGGAAWGVDYRVEGSTFTYLVERLDLTTGTVTEWLAGPANRQFAPLGTDGMNRLYVSDGFEVWRVARPGQVEHLLSPPPGPGASTFSAQMLYDSHGAWFPARGGVWLYSDAQGSRVLMAGPPNEQIFPAGPCV
jgi:hypothetical protein